MLAILTSYIKILHSILITYICLQICTPLPRLPLHIFLIELAFSFLSIIITKKHFLDVIQVVLTLNLTYALIPNNYPFIAGLYFFKIIYVFNSLGEAFETLLHTVANPLTKLLKFVLSVARYTLVEYLFLGLVMLGYKVCTLNDKEGTLPQDYVIMYKLIVTATTIGYGDITPKSKLQIYFFTYAIPFICASFVIYFNAVIPIIGEFIDFITGNSIEETGLGNQESLNSKIWSQAEKQSLAFFIDEVAKRQAEQEEHSKKLGQNWIAISANHYERQIPLITLILPDAEGMELKIKISSKIRRQYYPRGWTILQGGDQSEDLMMIDEGSVTLSQGRQTGITQKKGYVFNKDGFSNGSPSRETVVASQFVAIWAISMRDLSDLSKTSAKLQSLLKEGLHL